MMCYNQLRIARDQEFSNRSNIQEVARSKKLPDKEIKERRGHKFHSKNTTIKDENSIVEATLDS